MYLAVYPPTVVFRHLDITRTETETVYMHRNNDEERMSLCRTWRQDRVGCIEHELCVEGSAWSALLNAVSVCLYSVSESKLTKASLLSSSLPLPRLAFALLPSLVQPFLTYCSINEHCGQYFVLRANLYSWRTIINTSWWTGRFVLVINLLQNPLLLRLYFLCRDKIRSLF